MKKNVFVIMALLAAVTLLATQCGPAPTPERVVETVVVTQKEQVVVT